MASSTRQRETTREKGPRLHEEGKVRRVGSEAFAVEGSTGKYLLRKSGSFWICPCPSRKGDCSHVEAVHAARDEEMRADAGAQTEEEKEAFLRSLGSVASALGIEEDACGYAYDYGDEDEAGADEQDRLFAL